MAGKSPAMTRRNSAFAGMSGSSRAPSQKPNVYGRVRTIGPNQGNPRPMSEIANAALFAFPALMIAAALFDVATMTIPNRISIILVPAFFLAALLSRMPLPEIGLHLGVGVAALVLMIGFFAMGWLGGGDAKLLAAASLWVGPAAAAPFVVFTVLAGGGLALALLMARAVARPWEQAPEWVRRLLTPKGAIPYGVAIAAGAIAAFPGAGLGLQLHLPT
jgi:prepilin peptidase CpaA